VNAVKLTIACGVLAAAFGVPAAQAASFDCAKAKASPETLICKDQDLSRRDEQMADAFRKALGQSRERKGLSAQQAQWLKNDRAACAQGDNPVEVVDCLKLAYVERIWELGQDLYIHNEIEDVVENRCHRDTCSWFAILESEAVREAGDESLVRLRYILKITENPSGRPSNIKPYATPQWGDQREEFVFCSRKLPVILGLDAQRKKYIGRLPFADNDGLTFGFTEGDGNLFEYACDFNTGLKMPAEITGRPGDQPGAAELGLVFDQPVDVFRYQFPKK
jgi:uncharacterized protein